MRWPIFSSFFRNKINNRGQFTRINDIINPLYNSKNEIRIKLETNDIIAIIRLSWRKLIIFWFFSICWKGFKFSLKKIPRMIPNITFHHLIRKKFITEYIHLERGKNWKGFVHRNFSSIIHSIETSPRNKDKKTTNQEKRFIR